MDILQFIQNVPVKRYAEGETIFEENVPSDGNMYFVFSGEISIQKHYNGNPKEIRVQDTGTFFGEVALIGRSPRTATAKIKSASAEIGILNEQHFIKIAKMNPAFLLDVLKVIIERVSQAEGKVDRLIQELYGHKE